MTGNRCNPCSVLFHKLTLLPMCGFIAQLVERRTGIAEVMGSNPVEALIFFRLLLSNCLNWKIYCDDHTSLSFIMSVNFRNVHDGAFHTKSVNDFTRKCLRNAVLSSFHFIHSVS